MPNRKELSPWKLGGLSLKELASRVNKEFMGDDGFDVAAALGYYFLLSLFPMLIFFLSFLTLISSRSLPNAFLNQIAQMMPSDAYSLISTQMQNFFSKPRGGLFTFGALATLWAASSGVVSLIDGLNRAYEVKEARSFISRRLIAVGLTMGLALLTILGSVILVGSDRLAHVLYTATGLPSMQLFGTLLSVILGLVFMFGGLEMVFYFGPNVKNQKWNWISPGSLVGVVLFIIISLAFSQYLRFVSYDSYGSVGGVMILMLWLYNLGLAIVLGGEVNSEIAKAARAQGEKDAPAVGHEKEMESDAKLASTNGSASVEENIAPTGEKPYRKPVHYQPQLVYNRDTVGYSKQAKRRIAMRRVIREERSIERRNQPADMWSVLRRPMISLVYLGSIGVFLYEQFSKGRSDGS